MINRPPLIVQRACTLLARGRFKLITSPVGVLELYMYIHLPGISWQVLTYLPK